MARYLLVLEHLLATVVAVNVALCSNTNMTMWYEFRTLQWRHMSVMVSQVMVISTAFSTGCWGPTKKTSKLSITGLEGSTVMHDWVATPSCSCFLQIDFKWKHIWSNSLRMVMFYNCFLQHNYVTGIYHITVTSLEPPNLSQIPGFFTVVSTAYCG